MKKDRNIDSPGEFQLGPAQPNTATYLDYADYTGECSRQVEPMKRNRSRSFDDGSKVRERNR